MNNNFNVEKFKQEYNSGDIYGLEYLEKTIIHNMKEKNKGTTDIFYTKEDYIIGLFYACKHLNLCNDIYENSIIGKDFDYNLYFDAKTLLFEELDLLNKLEN